MSDFPRRIQMQKWCEAEKMIQAAVDQVECMGADIRLTDAVSLLGAARDRVADFVDGMDGKRTLPRSPEPRPEPEILARARAFVEGGISFDTRPEKQGPLIETLWNWLRVLVRAGSSGERNAP